MRETKLVIFMNSPTGEEIKQTISHANPDATNETLETFSQKLSELTKNTFDKVLRVDTTQLGFFN